MQAEAQRRADFKRYVEGEGERERAKQRIYQSDNGSELKNRIMKEALEACGVEERHSREYSPSTNGKIENRIKQVSRKVASELGGNLKAKKEGELKKAVDSAVALLNFSPSSITSFPPFQVTTVALLTSVLLVSLHSRHSTNQLPC